MCALFGLIDIKHTLSPREKRRILSVLGTFCEDRGVDATGYSYVSNKKLVIQKKAVPAHKMSFKFPGNACVIMGHTRMTTQGSADKNENNHPFHGTVSGRHFALAHNGVLSNDKRLRLSEKLPQTNIETDSYVAVQLIEKQKALDFHSLKEMAEKVKGTFAFTVLDQENTLYIIKGNNPLCLYYFPKMGFYIYASTKIILDGALDVLGYLDRYNEEISIDNGEILMIDAAGNISRDSFSMPASVSPYYDFYDYYDFWKSFDPVAEEPEGYRKELLEFALMMGIPQGELDHLQWAGVPDFELEECIYNKQYRRMCLLGTGYYSMEDAIYGNAANFETLPFERT